MNGMEGIFGIIGIGAGLYSLYAWFQLKFKGIKIRKHTGQQQDRSFLCLR